MNIDEAKELLEQNGYIVEQSINSYPENYTDAMKLNVFERRFNNFRNNMNNIMDNIQNTLDERGDYHKNIDKIYYDLSKIRHDIFSLQSICKDINSDIT